ncbi:MAG: UDP-2,3-diacylglucosamine diphosphatase [Betaproteobacteria bacterium]
MDRLDSITFDFRTVWISDIHLGTKDCKAKELLEFIKHCRAKKIYLVGDIIDGWALKKRWFWPQEHNDVIQKLLRQARKGTEVIFIPGNHDEFARQFCGLNFGGIQVRHDDVHVTADGKKLWVTHGDLYDNIMQYARWIAFIGDRAYTFALWLNRAFNRIRLKLNYPYWSLSQYLKHKVKAAVSCITAFEDLLIREAKIKQCDGVVCGHIHKAELRIIDHITYANDGDWVESMTALIENHDGSLQIIDWNEVGLINVLTEKETLTSIPSREEIKELS